MSRILLIDDDARFRAMASATLSRRHQVVEAGSCRAADKLLTTETYDLIIIDGLLPDGDGLKWIERYRTHNTVTPVLFVSAFWKKDERTRNLPRTGMMQKPLLPTDLLTKVENALRASVGTVELSADAQAELAELRGLWLRDMPQVLDGVLKAVRQLRGSPASVALRGVVRRRAHQVAGTAGSFGFTEVGDACAQIEQALQALDRDPAGAWGRIEASLSSLQLTPSAQLAAG